MVGILVRNRIGIEVYGTNTGIDGTELGQFGPGDLLTVEFRFACWLTPQQFSLTVATQNFDGTSQDWLDDAIVFDVVSRRHAAGVADLRAEVRWSRDHEDSGDRNETRSDSSSA
jgi:lipopolysaccharide transport system ATP-binding protein